MAEPVTTTQEPIEPIAAHERAEEEDEFETSDFDSATLSSSSTSLNTSIYQHAFENGRRYHQYRHGTYPIPNDDAEQNRDDMKHAMMLELTNGNLFFSPIVQNPQKIIDLATGTGIWAIDGSHMKPGAWIEIQELDARANCDDGSLAPDAPLAKFFDTAEQAVASFGMKFRAGENLREPLEKAGFTNVSCKVLKVPIGTWAKDKKLRLIGLYLKTAVSDMFGAMAAKPLRKILEPEEIEVFLANARKDLNNVNIHSYEKNRQIILGSLRDDWFKALASFSLTHWKPRTLSILYASYVAVRSKENLKQLFLQSPNGRMSIETLQRWAAVVDTLVHTNKFMVIDMELLGFCREANEQLQKFSDRLDHDLKYLELARNINQTRGVQQLTLLATIFLPLSLAAGVLSMQTRFRDLGTLVYDFFGVVVLLAAIVLIIMILLSLVAVVKELDSKVLQIESYRESFRVKVLLMVNIALFVFGCLVLSSFLIGMFKDVSLGATILGYGVAAICGLCMILFLVVGRETEATNESTSIGALVMEVVLEDRPDLELPASQFEDIVNLLRNRGHFTHEAWGRCLATLETVEEGDAEPGIFPVLDAMEDAFQEVVTDLKEISRLSDEAKEDVSILIRPELDVRVVRTFRNDLIKADEILLGRAKDNKGEPIERFVGVGKLCGEVLPQLEAFLKVQNNAEVVLMMILEIVKAQRLVEEHGEGKWLRPLKTILGEALYEQILEAGAA
ncbi:hypothetical protein FPRO04_08188 [Fusarium proliferatum]|nr:hypothetical protein FPRO03_11748 [Fusarium proliferatum]KAG4275674.1 hypothetical protein FPRO04_08188 [Fusarium proliferatum]